ncbi:Phenazine biosynthesis PhzF protein [Arabidopsis suecica]|uniref:Phenazine biosynthesis PhzF protein n=1 Tax=Arabidopsis suecica TaxID=45249 RepID=A0A8T1ZF11_ARASU|nr:Phenazine biosynthesis PhzF protein [Arabidopsis suecica]
MAMLVKKPVKYFMVNAFSESAFKGNPAVVCFLDGKNETDDSWLQSLASEFNIPLTCFVIPITASNPLDPPHFLLRWFTPILEVDLCAHATLASAHTLFSNGLVGSDEVEFVTHSGILTAKRVSKTLKFYDYEEKESFLIELDFPVIPTCEYNSSDISMFSKALNGATIVDVQGTKNAKIISQAFNGAAKATSTDKIIVVLPSWESVTELQPRMDDISKCPGKLIIVTAAAPKGSVYDFCSRVFAPKLGVDEVKNSSLHAFSFSLGKSMNQKSLLVLGTLFLQDSVCGSAHCALAHYWSLKMNKCDFVAYAASHRSGRLKVHYDQEKQRVLLTGKAVTVMRGSILV